MYLIFFPEQTTLSSMITCLERSFKQNNNYIFQLWSHWLWFTECASCDMFSLLFYGYKVSINVMNNSS